jgi:hypothetical protein
MSTPDMINEPPHYNQFGIECIRAIEASMSKLEFEGYLKGNIIKYLWRLRYKGKPLQDANKAQFYLVRLIDKLKEQEDVELPYYLKKTNEPISQDKIHPKK